MKKIFLSLLVICITIPCFAKQLWLEEADDRMSWFEANKYCKNLGASLPSKKQFIKVWNDNNKASDILGFDLSVSYWTKDEVKDNLLAAYPFYFMKGRDTWYYKKDRYGVRCIKNK